MIQGLRLGFLIVGSAVAVLLTIAMLSTFERPPTTYVQRGYRGLAMVEDYNPRKVADYLANNTVPTTLPPMGSVGPKASVIYKNVQVLGGLSVGEFTRLMASITTWVAPEQGCAYCHNIDNMADDSNYTKVVARRMIQMVQYINSNWKDHVDGTGVTCWTCHRGNPVPQYIWFNDPGPDHSDFLGTVGKNYANGVAGDSSLPYDPFTPFLEKDYNIRVQGETALPTGNRQSIKQTDWTYSLMFHFSSSLGVNCTYCHNSRDFGDWSQSTPQRVTAWYGIRMVRSLNNEYLDKLHDVFPAGRLGPLNDAPKVNCMTCHQGVYKPLLGAKVLTDFQELAGPVPNP